MIIALKQFIYL